MQRHAAGEQDRRRQRPRVAGGVGGPAAARRDALDALAATSRGAPGQAGDAARRGPSDPRVLAAAVRRSRATALRRRAARRARPRAARPRRLPPKQAPLPLRPARSARSPEASRATGDLPLLGEERQPLPQPRRERPVVADHDRLDPRRPASRSSSGRGPPAASRSAARPRPARRAAPRRTPGSGRQPLGHHDGPRSPPREKPPRQVSQRAPPGRRGASPPAA